MVDVEPPPPPDATEKSLVTIPQFTQSHQSMESTASFTAFNQALHLDVKPSELAMMPYKILGSSMLYEPSEEVQHSYIGV